MGGTPHVVEPATADGSATAPGSAPGPPPGAAPPPGSVPPPGQPIAPPPAAGGGGGRLVVRLLAASGALVVVVVVLALFSGSGEEPAPADDPIDEPVADDAGADDAGADDAGDDGLDDEAVEDDAVGDGSDPMFEEDEVVGDGSDPALEEELDGGLDPALDDDAIAEEEAALRLMVATAIDAFIASESTCAAYAASVGNPPPDPARFQDVGVEQVYDDGTVLIVDGLGTELLVDLNGPEPTFSSVEGPQAILPRDLSFGCPPELYLGTLPS